MVEAAATCNYELARQAMFLDPLVSNCKYPELLLKDLIRANLDLLPEAWENIVEWRKRGVLFRDRWRWNENGLFAYK